MRVKLKRQLTVHPADQLLQSFHFVLDSRLSKRVVVLKTWRRVKDTAHSHPVCVTVFY